MGAGRIWIVSEPFYPEETSTGYLLTKIAEGLAARFPVIALCGQPSYSGRGRRAPKRESYRGIEIVRSWSTTLNKDVLAFRALNLITISCSTFVRLLRGLQPADAVIVVTNPPLLPFLTALACKMKRARCVLLIHDVYPESFVAAGLFSRESVVTRMTDSLTKGLYGHVDRVIVLGRDMQRLVLRKLNGNATPVMIIPNWADTDEVVPSARRKNRLLAELGLGNDKFVVQYAGNMGRTHGVELLLEAAVLLAGEPEYHFLFIGSGAKKGWLEEQVSRHELRNVTVLPNRPRSDQGNFLNACDVAIVSFLSGMTGVSVPSRMYNIMAAGKPIVAVCDPDSELALVVREQEIGWVVPPGNAAAIAVAVRDARSDSNRLRLMGERARDVAATRYPLSRAIESYGALVDELGGIGVRDARIGAVAVAVQR